MVKAPQIVSVSGLSQTDVIFGVVLFAFIVFITVRGELGSYLKTIGL